MAQKISAPLGSGRVVRSSPRLNQLVTETVAVVGDWLDAHPRARLSWSGGKDSTLALWFARQARPDIPVCFFDSGLEYPQTLRYIDRLTDQWDLNLHVYQAEPDALELLAENGSWDYFKVAVPVDRMFKHLIEIPSAQANSDHGPAVLYGLRAEESKARRALLSSRRGVVERHAKDGTLTEEYLAPIWRWTTRELHTYTVSNNIPLNPLYAQMASLGVPEKHRRVGTLVDGSLVDSGRWVTARLLAPDLCRRVEVRLPRLAEFR